MPLSTQKVTETFWPAQSFGPVIGFRTGPQHQIFLFARRLQTWIHLSGSHLSKQLLACTKWWVPICVALLQSCRTNWTCKWANKADEKRRFTFDVSSVWVVQLVEFAYHTCVGPAVSSCLHLLWCRSWIGCSLFVVSSYHSDFQNDTLLTRKTKIF